MIVTVLLLIRLDHCAGNECCNTIPWGDNDWCHAYNCRGIGCQFDNPDTSVDESKTKCEDISKCFCAKVSTVHFRTQTHIHTHTQTRTHTNQHTHRNIHRYSVILFLFLRLQITLIRTLLQNISTKHNKLINLIANRASSKDWTISYEDRLSH